MWLRARTPGRPWERAKAAVGGMMRTAINGEVEVCPRSDGATGFVAKTGRRPDPKASSAVLALGPGDRMSRRNPFSAARLAPSSEVHMPAA